MSSPPRASTGGESTAGAVMSGINMGIAQNAGLPPHDLLGRYVWIVTFKQNQAFTKEEAAGNTEK
jgi:hypothetical protein